MNLLFRATERNAHEGKILTYSSFKVTLIFEKVFLELIDFNLTP